MLGDVELSRRFSELEEESEKEKLNRSQGNELEYSEESVSTQKQERKVVSQREKPEWEDTLANRMVHWNYSDGQKKELHKAIDAKIPKDIIMQYFYPDVSVDRMKEKFALKIFQN